MKKKKKIIIGAVVLVVVAGGALFLQSRNRSAVPQGIPVEAVEVTRKTVESYVSTKGNVELVKMETIAAETQAKILSVNVKTGDYVKAGDILIEYDPKSREKLEESLVEAQLSLKTAELSLRGQSLPASTMEVANAQNEIAQREKGITDSKLAIERAELSQQSIADNLATAQRDLQSKEALFGAGAISRTELDAAKTKVSELEISLENGRKNLDALNLELGSAIRLLDASERSFEILQNKTGQPATQNQIAMAQISVEQQQLRISQIEKQLEEFKLVEISPIDGDVINVLVDNGYVTQAGDRLMNLGDTNELIIKTEVVEYDIPSISVGQSVELTGEALRDSKLMGKVASIAPSAAAKQIGGSTGNVVQVEIELAEENSVLKPGFSVTAKILTAKHENALSVPLLSLTYDKEGEYSLFVIKDDNTVEKRKVQVISFAALDAVIEGVSDGEKIVSSPPSDLEDGALVSVGDGTGAPGMQGRPGGGARR